MRPVEMTTCMAAHTDPSEVVSYNSATSTQSGHFVPWITVPFATGVFATMLTAGTGGSMSPSSVRTAAQDLNPEGTGASCRVEVICAHRWEEEEDAAVSPTLQTVQHYLSLNLSDLASVLGVSRPTVYSWLRGDSTPQQSNASRLVILGRVARIWLGLSPKRMGTYLKRPRMDGRSVFDLLCDETINIDRVRVALESTARAIDIDTDSAPRRTRSADEIARQFGLRRPSKQISDESLEQETGL